MFNLTPEITLMKSCDTVNLYELIGIGDVACKDGDKVGTIEGILDGISDGCSDDGRTVGSNEGLQLGEVEDIEGEKVDEDEV